MRRTRRRTRFTRTGNSVNTADQKSIFGVLVALAALFILWLWASGNAATLWAAATGNASSSTTATTGAGIAAPNSGSFGTYNSVSPTTLNTTVNVPNYTSTLPAVQLPSPTNIAGATFSGATNGGVSVTPTVLANSNSVPAIANLSDEDSLIATILGLGTGSLGVSSGQPVTVTG